MDSMTRFSKSYDVVGRANAAKTVGEKLLFENNG